MHLELPDKLHVSPGSLRAGGDLDVRQEGFGLQPGTCPPQAHAQD